MTIWVVIWVVCMCLWLFLGCYGSWEPTGTASSRPVSLGLTLIPFICVLILGLVVFGAISPGIVVVTSSSGIR